MSDPQLPSENAERIARAIHEFREAMSSTNAAERRLLHTRLRKLSQELNPITRVNLEATVNAASPQVVSDEESNSLTHPIGSIEEGTKSLVGVD